MNNAVKIVQSHLFEMQDEKYKAFQAKLMPTVDENRIIGVRTPLLRKYAKELAREDYCDDFIATLPHDYYDEYNLHGFVLENVKDYNTALIETKRFLPYVDNWATCDLLSPKVFKKNTELLINEITAWMNDEKTYTIRFGIEMLMSHYLDEKFKPEYLQTVANVKSEEYYVNMMIAWLFATSLAKQYDSTVIYIEQGVLEKWVHNKTIQKAVESYRITDEKKEYLKSLRKK